LKEEKTMLKTISAALLAVSVLAAPALAAGTDKTAQAPVTKSAPVKASVLSANAKMGRHHVRHASHHRFHKKMAAHKTHRHAKIAVKHVTHTAKRG
jgi:hypothetical protein